MSESERVRISDPERIRALAHPLRLELLDYLSTVPDATATQCSEHTGESVASCSFHLRMLAKYGYIEPAERRGREKPWKIVREARDYQPDRDVPGSLAAATELASHLLIYESERIRAFLGNAHREDPEWVNSSAISRASLWLTRDEMQEISEMVAIEIATRYMDRSDDPDRRPEGARLARLFFALNPEPRPDRKEQE